MFRPQVKAEKTFATQTCLMAKLKEGGEEGATTVVLNTDDFAREVMAIGDGVVSAFKVNGVEQ